MEQNSIIKYSYTTIQEISSKFDAILDEEIINNLLEIKKNNRFLKKRKPLRLKYKLTGDWRDSNCENTDLSIEERYDISINSNLNKLTDENFINIYTEILKTLNSYVEISDVVFIDLIFEKGMEENLYSNIYSKLLGKLLQEENKWNEHKEYIVDKCNKFYSEKIDLGLKEITVNKDTEYSKLCDMFSEKEKYLGGFILIANLFEYNIVEYSLVKNYFEGLLTYAQNSPKDNVGIYIDTIVTILNTCGYKLFRQNTKEFKNNYLQSIMELSNNKQRISAKYRFKLKDILDIISQYIEE